jgi:hypothetical protein
MENKGKGETLNGHLTMKTSIQSRLLACAFFFMAGRALADRLPTPEEAGVPNKFRTAVIGSVVLKPGGTATLSMSQTGLSLMESGEAFRGVVTRWENYGWHVFGPGEVINQGTATATIRATVKGKGYIQAHRRFAYIENNTEKNGLLIGLWVLVVNASGQIVDGPDQPPGTGLPESTIKPDIPKALIKGRAVMRGTDTGVPGASVELRGVKTGVLRSAWQTGPDGEFNIDAENLLSVDRYEVFVRKASRNAARPDSYLEDLWPIFEYLVSVNRDNCLNLNVGRIEMATVGDLWGGTGAPADRKKVDVTPQPGGGGAGPATTGPGQAPGAGAGGVPPSDQASGSLTIFKAPAVAGGGVSYGPDANEPDGPGADGRSLQIGYTGYVAVDFNLKATLALQLNESKVTGELYAPPVFGSNVRLPGARMQLAGTLTGGWEDGGSMSGNCTGNILWPGGTEEPRAGQFQIEKVGSEIHFRSTKFYYNHYVFGAKGVTYAASAGNTKTTPPASGAAVNSVVILVDASGSMQGVKMDNAKATARQRIASLQPDTELAVIAFSGNSLKFPFAAMDADGRARAQAAIDTITAGGGTPLAAAIRNAGGYLRGNAGGKRLTLIVLSDGEETGGGDPPAEVRRLNDLSVDW